MSGGSTVLWGVVYLNGHSPTKQEVETALKKAGCDLEHNTVMQASF